MAWITLSLTAAFLNAFKNILTKKVSFKSDQYTVAWVSNLLALPFLYGALLLSGIPKIDPHFWLLILAMMPFELIVNLLFYQTIKDHELSEAIPFVAFLPLFIAVFAYFILKENLSEILLVAVGIMSLGAYLMNLDPKRSKDWLNPIRSLFSRGGSKIILVTAIWGLLTPLGKLAVQYSSATMFPAVYFTFSTLIFTPFFLWKSKNGLQTVRNQKINYSLIGLLYGLFLITNWLAMNLGPTAGVSAFSQLGIFFTVILSGIYLKEKNLRQHLLATTFMLTGAILIILKG